MSELQMILLFFVIAASVVVVSMFNDGEQRGGRMKPLEAWRIISGCMNELANIRQALYPQCKGYSQEEVKAEVICFEALRKLEEESK